MPHVLLEQLQQLVVRLVPGGHPQPELVLGPRQLGVRVVDDDDAQIKRFLAVPDDAEGRLLP
ncbi:hypothetical protein [Streptomyces violaceus]|uniref:Uncharacterized protein n=1 Tax=Streptomyces violaceus TaxID=1936 RepID=A0ABY9U0L2_STRVL|nr:hypothetical protein [Streptomyces janthinus]WND15860.1 hypothetical protein RI060_00015 [Streptomyces janthinus]